MRGNVQAIESKNTTTMSVRKHNKHCHSSTVATTIRWLLVRSIQPSHPGVLMSIFTIFSQPEMPRVSTWHKIGNLLGELIVSRYIAESITTDAERFSHVGLCQVRTKLFCMQLIKGFVAETSCISCYWFCYVTARDQFAQYRQHGIEPVRHHCVPILYMRIAQLPCNIRRCIII